MSTTPPGSPRNAVLEVPYFFTNTSKQLPHLATSGSPASPLTVEPSSTPVLTGSKATSKSFADSDGEAVLTDEDSDNPDLSPREKLSFGQFNKQAAARVKSKENIRRFRPVTPNEKTLKFGFAKDVTPKETSGKRVWHSGFTPTRKVPEPKLAVDMTATIVDRGMWDMTRLMNIITGPKPKMTDLVAGEGCAWKGVVVNGGHVLEEPQDRR